MNEKHREAWMVDIKRLESEIGYMESSYIDLRDSCAIEYLKGYLDALRYVSGDTPQEPPQAHESPA